MDKELLREFLEKKNIFAVVGVSRNPEKYGNKVYRDLKGAGYTVYPINPNAVRINGDVYYHSLAELPERPDIVDMVIPPRVTETLVRECKKLGIGKVWMQPGSESGEAIGFCMRNNIKVLHSICIMVERSRLENG